MFLYLLLYVEILFQKYSKPDIFSSSFTKLDLHETSTLFWGKNLIPPACSLTSYVKEFRMMPFRKKSISTIILLTASCFGRLSAMRSSRVRVGFSEHSTTKFTLRSPCSSSPLAKTPTRITPFRTRLAFTVSSFLSLHEHQMVMV